MAIMDKLNSKAAAELQHKMAAITGGRAVIVSESAMGFRDGKLVHNAIIRNIFNQALELDKFVEIVTTRGGKSLVDIREFDRNLNYK